MCHSEATVCSSLTSVHPLETNGEILRAETTYETPEECEGTPIKGVHARYHRRRAVIIRTLRQSDEPALVRRADRLKFCSCSPHVRVAKDSTPCLVLGRCRDRLCPLCSHVRGTDCALRLTVLIRKMNAPRFVTLTLRNGEGDLAAQCDRLMDHFKQLRVSKFWKQHVSGGTYSLEVTFNSVLRTWHPHLHLVVDGSFIPQKELATVWEKITGDSRIVWIEKVNDAQRTAKYLATYVNTPPDLHEWGCNAIVQYAIAMKGRRLIACFGSLHAANVDAANEQEAPPQTTAVCSIADLAESAYNGNVHAQEAMTILPRMGGAWAAVASRYTLFPPTNTQPATRGEVLHFGRLCIAAFTPVQPERAVVACPTRTDGVTREQSLFGYSLAPPER